MTSLDPFDFNQIMRLLDELPDTTLLVSSQFNLIWANHQAEVVFQATNAESVGRSVIERIHPDDLEIARRSFESVLEREIGNPIEIRLNAGGGWRLFEVVGRPVEWFQPGAVLFIFRDITDRRRFEVSRDDVARFRSIVQYSNAIVILVSKSGCVESVSGAITRNLGLDPEFVAHQPLSEIVFVDDRPVLQRAMDEALLGAHAINPVVCCVRLRQHQSEEVVAYELSIVNLLDDATVEGILITAHDVSATVAAESELQETLRELRKVSVLLNATLESTADGILVVDVDRRITSINRQFLWMWNLDESTVAVGDSYELTAAVASQLKDPERTLARIEELYLLPEGESDDMVEFLDGRIYHRFSKPQYVDDEVVGRVWSFIDVTAQKRLESDLQRMAFYDDLTGLANRSLFRVHLDRALTRMERSGKYVAVLFLDVDDFKAVNDSLGHSVGDEVLKRVGVKLLECLRRTDTAARLGGDEFAILMEDIDDRREALLLAERIITSMREPMLIGTRLLTTTASIGVTYGSAESTGDQLLRAADLAMYRAKAMGKDHYEEFHDHMDTAVLTGLADGD